MVWKNSTWKTIKAADKGMNQTPDDDYTLMDMNPAYQST